MKEQIKTFKIKNIEIIQDNHENLQRNLQLLADKQQLLKENNETKQRIIELETRINNLNNQIIDIETKEKEDKQKIVTLTIMNLEILEKLQYHEQTNFKEFQNNINNYFTSFVVGFLNYIINDYFLNILKDLWEI